MVLVNKAVEEHDIGDNNLNATKCVVDKVGHLLHLFSLLRVESANFTERFEDESHC